MTYIFDLMLSIRRRHSPQVFHVSSVQRWHNRYTYNGCRPVKWVWLTLKRLVKVFNSGENVRMVEIELWPRTTNSKTHNSQTNNMTLVSMLTVHKMAQKTCKSNYAYIHIDDYHISSASLVQPLLHILQRLYVLPV